MNFDRRSILTIFLGAPLANSLAVRSDLSPSIRPHALPTLSQSTPAPLPPLLQAWLKLPRLPLGLEDLDWATEYARNELHHALVTPEASREQADAFRDRLRELDLARQLLPRLRNGGPVQFSYLGGSSPGIARSVLPTLLFTIPNSDHFDTNEAPIAPIYLLAHCSNRQAPRTFKLANIVRLNP